MHIRRLPIELLTEVAKSIGLEDLFHLSLTCRQFQYLIRDRGVCRVVLEVRSRVGCDYERERGRERRTKERKKEEKKR